MTKVLIKHHVSLNNAKMTPRKARAFRGILIKRNALLAANQLDLEVGTDTAKTIAKLIKSGIAGLKLKDKEATEENVYVDAFMVNEGLKMKRQFMRSRGRATRYMKQNCQINLDLIVKKEDHPSTPPSKDGVAQGDFPKENRGTKS